MILRCLQLLLNHQLVNYKLLMSVKSLFIKLIVYCMMYILLTGTLCSRPSWFFEKKMSSIIWYQ